MKRWPLPAAVLLGALAAPPAIADPGQPDLNGYTPVNTKDYATYYNYPTTNGVQFVTPGGYRCRISYTGRHNPPIPAAQCRGALPGTSFNFAGVNTNLTMGPARFDNVDLAKQEIYWEPDNGTPLTVSPDAYQPLPAGSKVTYPNSGTCGVTDVTTTCFVGDRGFVLDPQGSRTF